MDWPDCAIEDRLMPMPQNKITIAPHLRLRHHHRRPARGAAGAAAARLCGIDALLARAGRAALGDMGYRAIAPSQRGYSPGARPDPREFSHYPHRPPDGRRHGDRVRPRGYGEARFHLAGHDWGGSIAWGIADRYHDAAAPRLPFSRGRIRTHSTAR